MRTPYAPIVILGFALVGAGCGGGSRAVPDHEDPPFDPPLGLDVRLNTDEPGEELSTLPQICSDGARTYVVWYDRRDGDRMDVRFNRSLDGGASWLAHDRRLDTDAPGAANSNVPRLCCDGDRVYVVWSDRRDGPAQIRFNRSLDAGATWLANDVRLDDPAPDPGASTEVRVCCDGDRVYVVWQDRRSGAADIRFNRSGDAGATWLPADVRLDGDVPGAASSQVPWIACAGDHVFVAWQDARDGEPDIYFRHSGDGGGAWDPERRLDGGVAGDDGSYAPRIALEGVTLCVLFTDDRNGDLDLYANASADGGGTWLFGPERVDTDEPGSGDSLSPSVVLRGGTAYAAWEDYRHGAPDVFFSRSPDGGATWLPQDVRLSDAPGLHRAVVPALAATASHLHVVWADDGLGAFDVLLRTSADQGASWRDPPVRLDTDAAGSANSLFPALAAAGTTVRVAWSDDRFGPGDIFFNQAEAEAAGP